MFDSEEQKAEQASVILIYFHSSAVKLCTLDRMLDLEITHLIMSLIIFTTKVKIGFYMPMQPPNLEISSASTAKPHLLLCWLNPIYSYQR